MPDDTEKTAAEAPAEAPEPEGDERDAPKAVPLLALDSQALVTWFTGVLASRAWVDMGLLADPLTGQMAKKLESARLAIDAFEGLVKILKGKMEPGEVRKTEALLADLRLNYVRQAGSE